jgi:outer membrane protein assembly factor BamE (lipoprotein component of BamABCDE complex)
MRLYFVILLILGLASCKTALREGSIIQQKNVEKIQLGNSKTDVINILGSPSITLLSANGENLLFYIEIQKEKRAFFMPKTVHQKVLELTFKQNKLISINQKEENSNIDYRSNLIMKHISNPIK